MKQVKLIALSFVIAIVSVTNLSAQTEEFQVPDNYVLKAKEDYPKYDSAMIGASIWLENTDLDKAKRKRIEVNTFVFQWTQGVPYLNIDIPAGIIDIYGKNDELLLIYMAGYSRYYLEHKATATKLDETKAGLISIIKVYKKGIAIKKSRAMEKAVQAYDENKLDDYVKDKFK